jgi:hypothetical protein
MSTIEEMQKIADYLEEKIPADLDTKLSRTHLMEVIGIYRDVAKNRNTLMMPPWIFKEYRGIHNDEFVVVGNHTSEGMKGMLEDYFGISSISLYAAQLDKRLRKFYFEGRIRSVEEVDEEIKSEDNKLRDELYEHEGQDRSRFAGIRSVPKSEQTVGKHS